MSSQIIETNPTQGSATTSSVRNNFGAAKKEINDLQKMSTMFARTAGDGAAYTVSFTDQFETDALVDGARITVEIHTISTSTTPTLNVTAGGTETGAKTIVKAGVAGGSALVAGDLKEDSLIELMYVASGGDGITDKWVWLNCASESANLTSPSLTSATIAAGALSGNLSGDPDFTGNPVFSGTPNFTGSPTATTQSEGDDSTKIATTAFVTANSGIKNCSTLRLQADVFTTIDNGTPRTIGATGNGSFALSNNANFGNFGSAVTVDSSTGYFTFPETGMYLIIAQLGVWVRGSDQFETQITATNDNFGSNTQVLSTSQHGSQFTSYIWSQQSIFAIFDCTNTTNDKVRLDQLNCSRTDSSYRGDANTNETALTFIRIANT